MDISLRHEGGPMIFPLEVAERLVSSSNVIDVIAEPIDALDDEPQIAQSRVCVHGRFFEVTVLIRPFTSRLEDFVPTRDGRQIPVMTDRTAAGG